MRREGVNSAQMQVVYSTVYMYARINSAMITHWDIFRAHVRRTYACARTVICSR